MSVEFIAADTTPEADRVLTEIYRGMTGVRRLELAMRASDSLRTVVAAGVKRRHPEYDDRQVQLAVIRLTLGDELFFKAYGNVEAAP